jgi:hypothetical protein
MTPQKQSIFWGSLIILVGLVVAHFGQLWLILGLFFSFPIVWFNSTEGSRKRRIDFLVLSVVFFALMLLLGWLSYFPIHSKLAQSSGFGFMAFGYYFIAAYRIKSIVLAPKYMLIVFAISALAFYLSFFLSNAIFDANTVPLRSAKREAVQMAFILISVNFGICLAIKNTDEH